MNNNGFKSGALIGSILGISIGMMVSKKALKSNSRKKMMKTAKKAKSSLINGMSSLIG